MERSRKIEALIVFLAVLVIAPVATLRLFSSHVEMRVGSRTDELRATTAALAGSMRARCAARLLVGGLDAESLEHELAAAASGVPRVTECAILDPELRVLAVAGPEGARARPPRTFTTDALREGLSRAGAKTGTLLFEGREPGYYAAAERVAAGGASYVLVVTVPAVSPREEAARAFAPTAATAVLLALLGAVLALALARVLGRRLTHRDREDM